jgi:hypothetical protein
VIHYFPTNLPIFQSTISVNAYHVKVINCGLSTIGNKKWKTITVPMGQTAISSVILQSSCNAKAMVTMIAVIPVQNMKLHLNFLNTLLIATKKLTRSLSLEVEPHSSGQLKKCARRACETCREMPPRNMVRRGIHFIFVQSPRKIFCSSMRWRRTARAMFPRTLKTITMAKYTENY